MKHSNIVRKAPLLTLGAMLAFGFALPAAVIASKDHDGSGAEGVSRYGAHHHDRQHEHQGRELSHARGAGKHSRDAHPRLRPMDLALLEKQLEAKGYTDVHKVEFEHGRYEIKAYDVQGRRMKFYFDPETGALQERVR